MKPAYLLHLPGGETALFRQIDAPLNSAALRELRDYWVTLKQGSAMPSRAQFDPVDIPHLLSKLILLDVVRAPLRFRHRVIGTYITELTQRDLTGQWLLEDYYGDKFDYLFALHRKCVEDRAPIAVYGETLFRQMGWTKVEHLYLPLSEDGQTVNMLLIGCELCGEYEPLRPGEEKLLLNWQRA
jgi:hypothetical protein